MRDMDQLIDRVVAARKARGWSQPDLARAAGVSPRSVSNFERRANVPQGATLRAIMRAVNLEEGGDEAASETRSEWPRKVQVFLDMMGLFLSALPEDEQDEVIYDLTRQIVTKRRHP